MWASSTQRFRFVAEKPSVLMISRLFSFSSSSLISRLSMDPIIRRQQLDAIKLRRRTAIEWHKKEMAINNLSWRRLHLNDPEFREQQRKREKEKYHTNPIHQLSKLMSGWLKTHSWVREELPWKTHRPVLHTSPVQHRCEVCGLMRVNGLLLVWQSIAHSDSYRCHRCCFQQGAEACMPKGYEDVRHLKDLVARKHELERPVYHEVKTTSTADGEGPK